MSTPRSALVSIVAALASLHGSALAAHGAAEILPTVTQGVQAGRSILRPALESDGSVWTAARQLDAIVVEAAQDLGLSVRLASPAALDVGDDNLVAGAKICWVISPRVTLEGARLRIRIVAVAPGSKLILTRSEQIEPADLEVRVVTMLRDVVDHAAVVPVTVPTPDKSGAPVEDARSEGRAVLAINSAALGAYVGLAVQRASGSDDPRLTYPLMALSTGVGLGASMIVADEWQVGVGDAWYLSAGFLWPAVGGFFLASGYGAPADDRHAYAVLGATAGATLATVSLSTKSMSEGGAVLTHSGGVFGTLFGSLTQMLHTGRTDVTPERGIGYGASGGVLLAGALATQVDWTPARVLTIDLGASLGALGGAAVASPALLVDADSSASSNRVWLASVGAGTLIGGGLALWLSTPPRSAVSQTNAPAGVAQPQPAPLARLQDVTPYAAVIGESRSRAGARAPVFGLGLQGRF